MAAPFDFSIVIPTRNRCSQLAVCLESLARLDYPRDRFEVIVVDDGGRVAVEPVLAPYRDRIDLHFVRQPHSGPAAARNAGAAIARGAFLAFTDDDCAPAPDWLQKLRVRLAAAAHQAAGGRTVNALPDNPYSSATQLLVTYLYEYFNRDSDAARFLASCNFVVSAASFRAIGGFDSSYPQAAAEDRDLCARLLLDGYRIAYAEDAIVYHRHPLTLCGFWTQHFRYGRGALRFHQAHRRRGGERIRIEPWPFYSGAIRAPFLHREIRRPLWVAALLVLTQAANTAGYFLPGRARERALLPGAPE